MYSTTRSLLVGTLASLLLAAAGTAPLDAQPTDEPGRWMVRSTASAILFNLDSEALHLDADNDVNIAADVTYFPTAHVGVNALVGFAAPEMDGIPPGDTDRRSLGSVKALPPTLTVQYHPLLRGAVRPYVGFGGNVTLFVDERGTLEEIDTEIDTGLGIAGQAGINFVLSDRVGIAADFRAISILNDPEVTTAVGTDELDMDYGVASLGVSFRP